MAEVKAYVAIPFEDAQGQHQPGEEIFFDLDSAEKKAGYEILLSWGLVIEGQNAAREAGLLAEVHRPVQLPDQPEQSEPQEKATEPVQEPEQPQQASEPEPEPQEVSEAEEKPKKQTKKRSTKKR